MLKCPLIYMGVKDERRKKRAREKLTRRVIIVALVVILVGVSRGTWNVFKKNQRANTSRAQQLRELEGLQERRDELAAQVSSLESDRGLEEELRTSFPVAADGEGVVVVTEEVGEEEGEVVETRQSVGFFNRIKDFFSRD